jgi:hypothetical protein
MCIVHEICAFQLRTISDGSLFHRHKMNVFIVKIAGDTSQRSTRDSKNLLLAQLLCYY